MSAPEALRERRVVHFIDNTSAQAALVKGYARGAVDSGVLVNAFHAYNVGLKADAFFEYVRSKANIADYPSRIKFKKMMRELVRAGLVAPGETNVRRVKCVLPKNDKWRDEAAVWIRRGIGQGCGKRKACGD